MNKDKISYNEQIIEYQIIRKKVKNLNISVKPFLEVQVIVNRRISEKKIKTFVNSKANWIYKHLEKFRKA